MSNNSFVIGHPIAHSKSPLIHSHWLTQHGIVATYRALDVMPADLPALFADVRAGKFVGGNVTIPHKQHALTLCDHVTPEATEIGAVNTLVAKNEQVFGSNTDISGFLTNLDVNAPGWDRDPKSAIVLGAGGAARAVLMGLRNRGFTQIHIINRTFATAKALAAEFKGPFYAHAFDAFGALAGKADLLVNTSSIGMHGTRFTSLDLGQLNAKTVVTDIVYSPLTTPLLAEAAQLGLKTVDGLGMLLHQAVPGFAAWYGIVPDVTPQLRALVVAALEAN